MEKSKKAKQAKIIIEKSMYALGISKDMKTNPIEIKAILKELEIDDFKTSFKPMNNFFKEIIIKPKSLKPMFKNIEKGLITKHPAIIEFLELALKKKWLKKSKKIQKSAQITFILEAIVAAMCNNHKFLIEAENHYRSKTKKLGLDRKNISKSIINAWSRFHNFFKVAKLLSIDPIMIYFRIQRGLGKSLITIPNLKKLYKNKEINYFEYKLLYKMCNKCAEPANKLIRINIYEAGTTEYKNNLKSNAISAYALAEDIASHSPKAVFMKKTVIPKGNDDDFYNKISDKENLFLDISANKDWVSLYITWNLAFILGNLENLDLLFPKLLMPSIINSEDSNFLSVRVVSLWVSINHFLFRNSKKIDVYGPSNKIEMANAWGEINKKYAFKMAKNKSNIDSKTLILGYENFFEHPIFRIFKLVKAFFIKTCKPKKKY